MFLGIDAPIFFCELRSYIIGDALIPVDAAQIHVAGGGHGVVVVAVDVHEGHVEGAAAEVIHEYSFVLSGFAFGREETLLDAIGDGGGRGFVDDVDDLQTGQGARILSGLAPWFVEKSGDRYDDLAEITELQRGVATEFIENERLNDFRRDVFAVDRFSIEGAAHFAFHELGHVFGCGNGRLDGFFADDDIISVEENGAGRNQIALGIGNRPGSSAGIEVGDDGESGSQINADRGLICAMHGPACGGVSK